MDRTDAVESSSSGSGAEGLTEEAVGFSKKGDDSLGMPMPSPDREELEFSSAACGKRSLRIAWVDGLVGLTCSNTWLGSVSQISSSYASVRSLSDSLRTRGGYTRSGDLNTAQS